MRGSSPLAQGKPQVTVEGTVEEGLIPADAGKTRCTPRPRRLCPAQPRSRGENDCWIGGCQWSKAHPRSRGENAQVLRPVKILQGSSPLTRGKPLAALVFPALARLIPAHAGKTLGAPVRSDRTAAHPRSRGENLGRAGQVRPDRGSSPLTRGKHAALVGAGHDRGLIPAHAGKTIKAGTVAAIEAAHPRSRGENIDANSDPAIAQGSSPLTRGKRGFAGRADKPTGLIPAHAGKTCFWSWLRAASRAHPRSRGENATMEDMQAAMQGSSPLTRGKPVRIDGDRAVLGLIPAHAGKTR